MLERFGIESRDYRNLAIVVAVVAVIIMALAEGPLFARLIVGIVGGLVCGVTFLVVTAVLNAYKPSY